MTGYQGIKYFLDRYKKAELRDIANVFGKDLSMSLKKHDMAEELATYLSCSPAEWMDFMFERDLLLLSKLVSMGPDKPLFLNPPDYPTILEFGGIISSDSAEGEDYHKVWITEDIYNLTKPHIGKALREGRRSGRFEIERVMIGYLNLYGIIPFEMYSDLLVDYASSPYSPGYDNVMRFIGNNPITKVYHWYDDEGNLYMCSPSVEDPGQLVSDRKAFTEAGEYKKFSIEDAIEAGRGAPYFIFGMNTDTGQSLDMMLRSLGYEGDDLIWEEHEIWMCAQNPEVNISLFDSVTSLVDSIPTEEMYISYLRIIADYANNPPKWVLNGHSAEETGYLRVDPSLETSEDGQEDSHPHWEMPFPTISDGYSDVIETDPQLDSLLSKMPLGFPFGMAIPHVSGDDPCPCGSGLKYSNCHGKIKS